ncbi:MAG: hypothetical protein H7227_02970, partial [Actinobacteria bacterium]|nr:hypothetical protein [Actinomycetota bacterium]
NASKRWAGVPYDIIRSAIPPRVASVDKENFEVRLRRNSLQEVSTEKVRLFWTLPASQPLGESLAMFAAQRLQNGQLLIICATERELLEVEKAFTTHFPFESVVRLDAISSRADRYRNFLRMSTDSVRIGIGLRGAVFTPLAQGSTIMVISESSEHLHEPRTPGWNARDVALLRSALFETNVVLAGFSPSLEAARLIETKWLGSISSRTRRDVVAQEQSLGALLPAKSFAVIRKALALGPVLCLVPRKGYGNAVLCAKCRNIAQCKCGGRLKVDAKNAIPECALCAARYESWRCGYCQGSDIYLAARGIERYIEEIGRAFPNFQIVNSSGENIVESVDIQKGLVVATPGAEPRSPQGYSAVVLLEGQRFFGTSDIRATERAREQFFNASHLSATKGKTFVAIDPVHPIVAALTRWDADFMVKRELSEQESAHLPPYFRFISLEIDTKGATTLHAGIVQARAEGRIPSTTEIRGPHQNGELSSRITLTVPVIEAPLLVAFVHELQRRRSLSRKPLLRIRVDPYSLA